MNMERIWRDAVMVINEWMWVDSFIRDVHAVLGRVHVCAMYLKCFHLFPQSTLVFRTKLDSPRSHLLAFVTMSVQIPVCASVSNFLGYILRNAIAGSYARSALHFLRIFCTIGCFILFFHQQCPRAVISPYLQQLLLFCVSDSHLSDVCEVISS